MGVHEFLDTFAGLPVVRWDEATPEVPPAVAWWMTVERSGETFASVFEQVMELAGPAGPTALIVSDWGTPNLEPFPVEVLTRSAARLGGLRALFLGEMSGEQCEISWIRHGDITPLLEGFPQLQHLWIRGGAGLELTPVRHENLHELVIQSGGLPGSVVRSLAACELPNLEELELWLGVAQYGGDARAEDLAPVLAGRAMPSLSWLGLRNAEITDELAAAVAAAPIVARLRVLDLSMGTLSDTGAEALLAGQPLTHLEHLVLHHHFLSREVARRLVDELPEVEVDISDEQQVEDRGRYTAVSE
ncbi:STM4015 family protein [Actinoplanes sp. NPDC020271]|uniref:STM4015 family protein n=1 Tax=Actinoplanes sp. NPDC020271 TaxID=3363896 RepID=UPI0037891DEA